MSNNDWWNDLYAKGDTLGGGPAGTDLEARTRDTDLKTIFPENKLPAALPNGFPSPPHTWGSGTRPIDHLFGGDQEAVTGKTENTVEENAELDSRQKEKTVVIPPMPTYAPSITDTSPHDEEKAEDEHTGTIKALISALREKKTVIGEKTEPARTAFTHTVTGSSGWSYLWSLAAAWTVPLTFPFALLDRIALVFGSPRPLSGTERMDWNLLHGPGIWFGEQIDAYTAAGDTGRMVTLMAIGLAPVVFAQIGSRITRNRLRKALGWIAYGFPAFFVAMPAYFDWAGFRTTNDLYITALAAASWWGFSYSRTVQPGLSRILLRIPLAAVIVGLGHTAPGAAF